MQGKILDYNNELKSGLIRGNDGNKYRFNIDDCKSTIKPKVNAEVDFEANADKAVEIYVLTKDTMDDVKNVASSTVNATAYVAKVGAEKSKKLIPMLLSLVFIGALVGIIAFLVDQSERRKHAEQLDQERQEYADLISRADQLIRSKDCLLAENILQDANQKLSTNSSLTDENQWVHRYDLAECYLGHNKQKKALSLTEEEALHPGYGNQLNGYFSNGDYTPYVGQYTKEQMARGSAITSKAYKLLGEKQLADMYAEWACNAGDCSLVEK